MNTKAQNLALIVEAGIKRVNNHKTQLDKAFVELGKLVYDGATVEKLKATRLRIDNIRDAIAHATESLAIAEEVRAEEMQHVINEFFNS